MPPEYPESSPIAEERETWAEHRMLVVKQLSDHEKNIQVLQTLVSRIAKLEYDVNIAKWLIGFVSGIVSVALANWLKTWIGG